MKYKLWFFAVSLLVILPGIYSLARWGLRLSIDFTGGTLLEIQNSKIKGQDTEKIKSIFVGNGVGVSAVQFTSAGTYLFRTKEYDPKKKDGIFIEIDKVFPDTSEVRFETVGPVVGRELTVKAIQAVALATLLIVVYIAYAFRQVPKPYSSWKFGVTAVAALLHDVLVVIGIFSILGRFYSVEIDALFITALLTVMGFSVHDTIVVFDRIRENLQRATSSAPFAGVVNESLIQTLGRSLMTSLTVLFTLLALILFGGETTRWFVAALFIGVFSGTYSSIFNAAPLLVLWEEISSTRLRR